MPTYQYRCTACGHDLEAVQKFSDAALTECPSCGGQLRKVYNAVGVVFKGSGFYRTDSRKVPSESGSADAGAGSGAGSKGSGDTVGAGTSNGAGSSGATPKETSGAGSSSSTAPGSSTAAKPAKAAGS
jgi:putative FmdB family regulatory protein